MFIAPRPPFTRDVIDNLKRSPRNRIDTHSLPPITSSTHNPPMREINGWYLKEIATCPQTICEIP
jgi:hypothetical protein